MPLVAFCGTRSSSCMERKSCRSHLWLLQPQKQRRGGFYGSRGVLSCQRQELQRPGALQEQAAPRSVLCPQERFIVLEARIAAFGSLPGAACASMSFLWCQRVFCVPRNISCSGLATVLEPPVASAAQEECPGAFSRSVLWCKGQLLQRLEGLLERSVVPEAPVATLEQLQHPGAPGSSKSRVGRRMQSQAQAVTGAYS